MSDPAETSGRASTKQTGIGRVITKVREVKTEIKAKLHRIGASTRQRTALLRPSKSARSAAGKRDKAAGEGKQPSPVGPTDSTEAFQEAGQAAEAVPRNVEGSQDKQKAADAFWDDNAEHLHAGSPRKRKVARKLKFEGDEQAAPEQENAKELYEALAVAPPPEEVEFEEREPDALQTAQVSFDVLDEQEEEFYDVVESTEEQDVIVVPRENEDESFATAAEIAEAQIVDHADGRMEVGIQTEAGAEISDGEKHAMLPATAASAFAEETYAAEETVLSDSLMYSRFGRKYNPRRFFDIRTRAAQNPLSAQESSTKEVLGSDEQVFSLRDLEMEEEGSHSRDMGSIEQGQAATPVVPAFKATYAWPVATAIMAKYATMQEDAARLECRRTPTSGSHSGLSAEVYFRVIDNEVQACRYDEEQPDKELTFERQATPADISCTADEIFAWPVAPIIKSSAQQVVRPPTS